MNIEQDDINQAVAEFAKQIPNLEKIDPVAHVLKVTRDAQNTDAAPYYNLVYFAWTKLNQTRVPLMITVSYQYDTYYQTRHRLQAANYVIRAQQLYIRNNNIIALHEIFHKYSDDEQQYNTRVNQYLNGGTAQYHSSNYLDYVDPDMMAFLHYLQIEMQDLALPAEPIKKIAATEFDLTKNTIQRILSYSKQHSQHLLAQLSFDTGKDAAGPFLDQLTKIMSELNQASPLHECNLELDALKEQLYISSAKRANFLIYYQNGSVALNVTFTENDMVGFYPNHVFNINLEPITFKLHNSIFAFIKQLDDGAVTKTCKVYPLHLQ